jgi:hypothetical protein
MRGSERGSEPLMIVTAYRRLEGCVYRLPVSLRTSTPSAHGTGK